MTDFVMQMTTAPGKLPQFDIATDAEAMTPENSLTTAVTLSLFTDRLANVDDTLPDESQDRRGWWADALSGETHDKIGSRLWLLNREKQTTNVLRRAEDYAYEALEWLIEDGIASSVTVTASNPRRGWLKLDIAMDKPDGDSVNFDYLWEALNGV